MRRAVEFDLFTKIEANARFASKQGMFAKSRRTADQRAAVKAVLASTFGALVPPRYVQTSTALVRNKIAVKLTRIAPGRTADAWENLRGSLKGVKDEVAKWCGFDDKEGAGITWLDPGQEQRGQHVYRVRIEITDDAPGQDRIVVLAETASAGRAASSRVKREVKAAGTRHGITVHSPEAGARAASSAARSKAEGAFAKLTGQPTALDLRDAAEGVLARKARRKPEFVAEFSAEIRTPEMRHRDPGEERPARDLAACTTCNVPIRVECITTGVWAHLRLIHGVHEARARAAGIYVDTPAPKKAPTNGQRRIVPAAQAPLPLPAAFLVLPWLQPPCDKCDNNGRVSGALCGVCRGSGWKRSRLMRETAHDGEHAPPTVRYAVPAEHRARFGDAVTLTRRRTTLAKIGDVWLYE